MKISTESIWDEMMAIMRSHQQVLFAIAGVFLFLPAVAGGLFMDPVPMGKTPEDVMKGVTAWLQTNWLAISMQVLVTTFGSIALYRCLLSQQPATAGEAITASLPMLPFVLLANIGTSFLIVIGLNLFILPGLYAAGRLLLVLPILVARDEKNILTGVAESFRLTQGNGWRLIGMVVTMVVVIFVAVFAASMVLGGVARLAFPAGISNIIGMLLQGLMVTFWSVGGIVTAAATYRIATR